jgi:hypothetical protein
VRSSPPPTHEFLGTSSAEAGHIDSNYDDEPQTYYNFFNFVGRSKTVTWASCQYLETFGLKTHVSIILNEWKAEFGYGIQISQYGTTCNSTANVKYFGHIEGCPSPNYAGCWVATSWVWDGASGLPAVHKAEIYLNGPHVVAYAWSGARMRLLAGHEFGHGMALGHHDFACGHIMSHPAMGCANGVEPSDLPVPRCVYVYQPPPPGEECG